MIRVDWTMVDRPRIELTLEQNLDNRYVVLDQHGIVYLASPDLDLCIRFMRAMAIRNDAVLDEDSITWWRMLRAGHSVRVPSLKDVWPEEWLPDNVIEFPVRESA